MIIIMILPVNIEDQRMKNKDKSYNDLCAENLAAGFPTGQLAELESKFGRSTRALEVRFKEWSRCYGTGTKI